MSMFISSKISNNTTCISDYTGASCFLIEGEKAAALIDTGAGLGDLKSFVHRLTNKPIIVILTHGHVDHLGGAGEFETVYIGSEDITLAKQNDTKEFKFFGARQNNPIICQNLTAEDMCSPVHTDFLPLSAHQAFDLGGIELETIPVPGHTKGFTMVLNITERFIIWGDGCNPLVFLCEEESTSVKEYRDSLLFLKNYENRYDRCCVSHGHIYAEKSLLDGIIKVCDELLLGDSDEEEFESMGRKFLLAHAVDSNMVRKDGGLGNILYRKDKL